MIELNVWVIGALITAIVALGFVLGAISVAIWFIKGGE